MPSLFKNIKISTLDILLDPFLNCLTCPINSMANCCGWDYLECKKRQKTMEKCEEKLNDELEIVSMLHKINSTHALLRHLMHKRHRDYMVYHKSNVVEIESDQGSSDDSDAIKHPWSSSSHSDNSSSSSEEKDAKPVTMKKKVRQAYSFVNMEKAFLYSIINDLNLGPELRQKVVKAEFKRLRNVAGTPRKHGHKFFGNHKPVVFSNSSTD